MKYAKVVIDNKSRYTDNLYTYRANSDIKAGDVVRIPFGKSDTIRRGFVFQIFDRADIEDAKIKDIIEVDKTFSLTDEIISTCIWMRKRYLIRYIDAVNCFIPKGKPAKRGHEKRPMERVRVEKSENEILTDDQEKALAEIKKAVEEENQVNFLLHGVTGSGKTEIYIRAAEEVLEKGKNAIVMVPEIALTKQVTERFSARFGSENIAILHSRLTARERFDEWVRIKRGEVRIVIGARIAVFAPLSDIGLIIMDEEHESTYKSDRNPKYDTVDIAIKRLIYYKGVFIAGSATPSVVSRHRAEEGIYKYLHLSKRYNGRKLPPVELVDMREELIKGNRGPFSGKLYKAMEETLNEGMQVILFLNRRGYASSVSCMNCGHTIKCPECEIPLTYHKEDGKGVCHYCGKRYDLPDICPECGNKYIIYRGAGTEKVEETARNLFPDKVVKRLDLDTAKSDVEIREILEDFAGQRTDILVGTQMVAKGLDFDNVGLVGVVSIDNTLSIPDYRSSERAFQLITQVGGRAGRGRRNGRVIVQTLEPDDLAVQAACSYDYSGFYKREVSFRKMMVYPPFSDIILTEFTARNEKKAFRVSLDCMKYIRGKMKGEGLDIYAPKKSERYKGGPEESFRYGFLVKSPKGKRNKAMHFIGLFGEQLLSESAYRGVQMIVDVNPQDIL